MDLQEILYEVGDDGVAVITLNRPDKMNSFTRRMIDEWAWAIEQAREDGDVRAVIVTGAGVRAFCAGMDMASMADMRFATDTARFGMSYVRMGIIPGDAGCYFLPRLVGLARALDLIWSGELFNAQQALEWGYVSRVYPADKLMEETRAYAAQLAEGPAVAIQLAKRLVYRSLETDLDHALDLAQSAMVIAQSTDDAKEGPRAFIEKRRPMFTGR